MIYQTTEDDAEDTIVPRFLKAGGDKEKLIFINESKKILSFSDERLLEAVKKTNAKLLVLDPLSAYIGEETNINLANTIYQDANKIFKRDYLMISLLIIDLTNAISYNMNIIS